MFRYEIQHGSYYLLDDRDEIINMCDTIAVGFSWTYEPEDDRHYAVLHKHGCPRHVNAWASKTRRVFNEAGHHDMANEIVVVEGKFDIEELNKIINNTGYLEILYKNNL